MNPMVAAMAGAVVGAGVAVAGAIAMKDEKNRKKVKGIISGVKDQAMGYVKKAQKKAEEVKGTFEKTAEDGKKEVKKLSGVTKGMRK